MQIKERNKDIDSVNFNLMQTVNHRDVKRTGEQVREKSKCMKKRENR